ncbi:S-(hydroxymethyl)glutathione dehydrogenase/alcohol dehydrogenase [Bradyrhizobium macuxiense]|uniref:S-(Hydroxymethyl)glutathione dehydrogenase/alcohol dehydrogenase n=1 Tax=Bradyrhizobium macuxiense TaxID=1755647 RepID=A0A560MFA3_9BRAD|nr:Zn-dependent alcohol dehydrogenase [Bradyrhizobium macuxiense]TWC05741.1 S-(hydroxymethyl)glutathione dehydrogenase/alcohol dehydrogenase [Bradyrhizobium macuxiense]
MTLICRAAVLHQSGTPLSVERVSLAPPMPTDVVVKVRAAGLCHTDLEVIDGSLRYPLPMILGHEAAGVVEEVGSAVRDVSAGDHVILSWNPHCGHCFHCDRGQPILCETYLAKGAEGVHFDGASKAQLAGGKSLAHLMFLGAFSEYVVLPAQQAIVVPKEIPFDRACLIGCGVMTGVGAALNVAAIGHGDTVMVTGCGAVGLAAVQGARLAGAGAIIAVDLDDAKLALARNLGATLTVNAAHSDPVQFAREVTSGRGADVILEAAGHPLAFRQTAEAVRPGGEVIWLGKIDVTQDVSFRWGALMGEKRFRRSSYGGARPRRDFPWLAQAYLDGRLKLDELITGRCTLDGINDGFEALRRGRSIRTVVEL